MKDRDAKTGQGAVPAGNHVIQDLAFLAHKSIGDFNRRGETLSPVNSLTKVDATRSAIN